MNEIINIIEGEMGNATTQHTASDHSFQLSLLVIATILVSLMEWVY